MPIDANNIARHPDGSVVLPDAREPSCQHYGGEQQPASACTECQHGERLAYWKRQWATYFAEHPAQRCGSRFDLTADKT